MTAMGCRRVD